MSRHVDHVAAGFASDDEEVCRQRQPVRGFGALPGDVVGRRKVSGEETLEYGVRQNASGPPGTRVRYLDALLAKDCRPTPAQTTPRTAFERHLALLSLVPRRDREQALKSDLQLLRESHRFLRSNDDEDGSWESRLARRYYDRLFKEYVVCDLAGYRKGEVGFRWRTETEVVQGKGQFRCGHKRCDSQVGLRSYEVDFKYSEAGSRKRALVKARLCEDCAYKLHYRRLKAAERKRRRAAAAADIVKVEDSEDGAEDRAGKRRRAKRRALDTATSRHTSRHTIKEKAAASLEQGELQDEEHGAADQGPGEADKRLLEALAWRGPDPEAKTREDDFDDYLQGLFC